MPAFNAAATVGYSIRSVLAQTCGDFELIVVDDGSTDGTRNQVRPYLADARVRLLSQQNSGQSVARNAGLAIARGIYVSLLDSDDLWLPYYLESMHETLRMHSEADVAYTDAWVLDDRKRKIARMKAMAPYQPTWQPRDPESFLRALLEFGNFVFVGATIRRRALEKVGFFRAGVEGSEDYELWLRLAAHGCRFVRTPAPLAVYRRRIGQTSAQQAGMRNAASAVLDIVAAEYDIPVELRELARRKLPLVIRKNKSRRIPRAFRGVYELLSTLRRFRVVPPKQVRKAFPDLQRSYQASP